MDFEQNKQALEAKKTQVLELVETFKKKGVEIMIKSEKIDNLDAAKNIIDAFDEINRGQALRITLTDENNEIILDVYRKKAADADSIESAE